jgi:hypothetical protein
MADTFVPSKTGGFGSILSENYGISKEEGPPIRQEDPARWHPPTVDGPATCKRYGATIDELLAWHDARGFPKPIKNAMVEPRPGNFFKGGRVYGWDLGQLAEYDAMIREMYAQQSKK